MLGYTDWRNTMVYTRRRGRQKSQSHKRSSDEGSRGSESEEY